jgi:hypothetical protein
MIFFVQNDPYFYILSITTIISLQDLPAKLHIISIVLECVAGYYACDWNGVLGVLAFELIYFLFKQFFVTSFTFGEKITFSQGLTIALLEAIEMFQSPTVFDFF